MNISYNWLKDYLNFNESAEEIATILTDLGLEIGSIEKKESIKGGLEGLIVGEVLTCEKHPDADKLKLTTVNVGQTEALNIVCGAPNVAVGQKVVVATIGTTLYSDEDSFQIKKSKIRGALSEGMLCGEDEIGLGSSHEGILVLDSSTPIGTALKKLYEVNTDYILEVDITPNRADALSHLGVARDLAVYFSIHKEKRNLEIPSLKKFVTSSSKSIKIEVQDRKACPKYCGISIDNLKIQASPKWLQDKLKSIGLKPINNVVDITNFVLMETGQSLHAFDLNVIGKEIVVGKSFGKQKFKVLDGTELIITEQDLMIGSKTHPHCLAGVMGGLESGVTEKTTSIFLEAAYFNPVDVRMSSKRHGIKSDSSYRFERGIDPNNTEYALRRAVNLILEITGGEVSSDLQIIQNKDFPNFEINFRVSQCNKVLGTNFAIGDITSILDALEIKWEKACDNELKLSVPPYRVDVQRECDVIEEILRVYGYNNIAIPENLNSSIVLSPALPQEKFQEIISNTLSNNGFNEILCNSLTRPEYYKGLKSYQEDQNVELLNPLSSDLSILRRSLLFGGLESIQRNQNMKATDLKLYEFGNVYLKNQEGKYEQEKHLSIFTTGNHSVQQWNTTAVKSDFFILKGFVEMLLERVGCKTVKTKASSNEFFSDGVSLYFKKNLLVEYGEIKNTLLKKNGIKQTVYYADFNWNNLLEIARNQKITYTELSKFHPVKRDLSLLLDRSVSFKDLENLAFETERELLQQVELFDVYQGDKLPENKKSYALSFKLQSQADTLKEKDIERVMSTLIKKLEDKFDAKLR